MAKNSPKAQPFEILTFEAADQRLDGALSASFQGGYATVLLFPGDLEVHGDFEKAVRGLCRGTFALIAVEGDLTVHGRIRLYDSTPGLYVGGTTTAETLEGGDCEIYISDGSFEYFVYGYYNDGILETGKVKTPWVINSNHDLRVTAGKQTKWIDNYADDDEYDFGSENIGSAFVREVLGGDAENPEVDVEKLYQRLAAGKPVLATGAKTNTQKALAEAKAAKQGRKTEFVNTSGKLKQFPKDVLKMTWLEKLVLDGNEIGTVPAQIGKLTSLRELSLQGCDLKTLPAELGKLTKLEILRVGGNKQYDWPDGVEGSVMTPIALPKEIGALVNLRELDVSDLSEAANSGGVLPACSIYKLPVEVGKLKNLRVLRASCTNLELPRSAWKLPIEELDISGSSWCYLTEFPAWVTSLTALRVLDASSQFFSSIPALHALTALEELDLGNSLGRVKKLPVLSKLTKLRRLNVSGNTDRTSIAQPSHAVLRPLFAMKLPALEDLRIDRWGKADKAKRTHLDPAILAGIGSFASLQKLDLEFDGLKRLPPDFYKLGKLTEIKLGYNRLGKAELEKLAKTFPNAAIDVGVQG